MEVTDYINGKVTYDKDGQYFWIHGSSNGIQMLAELRGWGHIQNIFVTKVKGQHGVFDMDAAAVFQDEVGEWIADAINAKIKAAQNKIDIRIPPNDVEIRVNESKPYDYLKLDTSKHDPKIGITEHPSPDFRKSDNSETK